MKIPLKDSDFKSGAFSKAAKELTKIPPGNIRLAEAQNILAQALGYFDTHDAQKSANTYPFYEQSPNYYLNIVSEKISKVFDMHQGKCINLLHGTLKYIWALNGDRQNQNLPNFITQGIISEIGKGFADSWNESSHKAISFNGTELNSFREIATEFLKSKSFVEQDLSLDKSLLEFFCSDQTSTVKDSFDKLMRVKSHEIIQGVVHRYYNDPIGSFVRSSTISSEKLCGLYQKSPIFELILEECHIAFKKIISSEKLRSLYFINYDSVEESLESLGSSDFKSVDDIRAKYEEEKSYIIDNGTISFDEFVSDFDFEHDEEPTLASYNQAMANIRSEVESELEELKCSYEGLFELKGKSAVFQSGYGIHHFKITQIEMDSSMENSPIPFEWACSLKDEEGSTISCSAGKAFLGLNGANSSDSELLYMSNNHFHKSEWLIDRYIRKISSKTSGLHATGGRNSGAIEKRLRKGPIVLVENVERDLRKSQAKGSGLYNLEVATNAIREFFCSPISSLCFYIAPTQFIDLNENQPEPIRTQMLAAYRKLEDVIDRNFEAMKKSGTEIILVK